MFFKTLSALLPRGPLASSGLLPCIYFIPAEKASRCISSHKQCPLRPFVAYKGLGYLQSADHLGLGGAQHSFLLVIAKIDLAKKRKGQSIKRVFTTCINTSFIIVERGNKI